MSNTEFKPKWITKKYDATPEAIDKIKRYKGTTTAGPHHTNESRIKPGPELEKFRRKGDTKIELACTALYLKGFTLQSIADESKNLFGISLSPKTVHRYVKQVLRGPKNRYLY
jgi:hypothetical protein